MRTPEDIIPMQQILKVHGNANFGPRTDRSVVNEAVLKVACGYSNGYTASEIIKEHGLIKATTINRYAQLTKKGKLYLWALYGEGVP